MADFDTTTWATDSLTKATATTSTNNNVTLGGTLAVTGATQLNSTLTVGVDATGYDVKFFGDTTGKYWLWDESADGVVLVGTSTQTGNSTITGNLTVSGTLTLGSGAELAEAELEMLDGITAGTAAASKAVVLDGSKNIATIGTISCGIITQSGATLATTYSPIAGSSSILTTGALDTGSITSGFTSIDVGAGAISTTGTVSSGASVIKAANDAPASILMQADNSDDAGDDWKLIANANQKFTIGNDIASAGTYVDLLTITPHATATTSQVQVAGTLLATGGVFATGSSYLSTPGEIRVATTVAITLDAGTKATFNGYVVEGRTVIKIPATAFISNDDYSALAMASIEDDGSVYGIRVGNTANELYAYIDVPLGYTATKVRINGGGNSDIDVEVYTLDLDAGTISSEISASGLQTNDDTALDSNHVGADDKMLFIKVVTTAVDDIVWGGYVTIEAT